MPPTGYSSLDEVHFLQAETQIFPDAKCEKSILL